MVSRFRILVPLALTVVALVLVFTFSEPGRVAAALAAVSWSTLVVALVLIAATLLLSCVRYHFLLRDLGFPQTFGESFRTNVYSVVGGMLLFNFFGQAMTRSAFLSRVDGSPAVAVVVTGVERAVGLILLLGLAVAGALMLFGGVSIRESMGSMLVALVVNLAVVGVLVIVFGLRRLQRRLLRSMVFGDLLWPVMRAGVVTLAMYATMMAAYVILAMQAAPGAALGNLFAVSAIVMFAAALPISFAGWGVREFTAAYAFGAVGLDSAAGLTTAILVGLLSLAALGGSAVVALALGGRRGASPSAAAGEGHGAAPFIRLLSWGLPALAAALVVFRVPLPTASGLVNVNLGDPVAIVGAFVLVALMLGGGRWRHLWRVRGLTVALGLTTAVIVLGFLNGWASFGLTDWALYNRLIGWAILLSFLLTGALVSVVAGRVGTAMLFRVFVVAACAVVVSEAVLRLLDYRIGFEVLTWASPRFSGMVGNPNAFSFQLALALAIALPVRRLWVGRLAGPVETAFLGLIVAGLWFSASRAGFITVAVLVALYLWLGLTDPRRIGRAVAAGLVIVVGWELAMTVAFGGGGAAPGAGARISGMGSLLGNMDYVLGIQADRIQSFTGGLAMWRENPVFGAGLGAFMHQQIEATGVPLVVHNSLLWLAAEFGLVGLLAVAVLPATILWALLKDRGWRAEWSWVVALGGLVALGIFSMVHDMVYQRAFWLLLGAAVAAPRQAADLTFKGAAARTGHGSQF